MINNPKLPEVQTQQSFAYGSTKTPYLPDKLVARERMSLQQMAETIDVGIRQAEQNLEDHAAKADKDFALEQSQARADRARRRSSTREGSDQSSRENSVESHNTDTRATRRTAAWASSVVNSQLEGIEEEGKQYGRFGSQELDDDYTRRGSEPSSFPTGNFDISYNQERNGFRPVVERQSRPQLLSSFGTALLNLPGQIRYYIARPFTIVGKGIEELARSTAQPGHLANTISGAVKKTCLGVMSIIFAVAAVWMSWNLFCHLYTNYLCDPNSTSGLCLTLQNYCGSCGNTLRPPPETWDPAYATKILEYYSQRLRSLETKQASLSSALEYVVDQQYELEAVVSHLQHGESQSHSNSLNAEKINYASVGNGAVIDPYLTSPTKQKRHWLDLGWMGQKYQSKSPVEVLRPWIEAGECWCAAKSKYVQLGILLGHEVFPKEVVIEHAPTDASPSPGTAPRDLEIWADVSHLKGQAYLDAGIDKYGLQSIQGKSFAHIGTAVYDATAKARNVQTFRLDVNQNQNLLSTQTIVFRATSNHGGEHTCFYRVRVHGTPVTPHPEMRVDGKTVS